MQRLQRLKKQSVDPQNRKGVGKRRPDPGVVCRGRAMLPIEVTRIKQRRHRAQHRPQH